MLKKFFENVKNPKNNFGGRFMVERNEYWSRKIGEMGQIFSEY